MPGRFSASPFVREVTGVDNVCERAAVLAGGGRLAVGKTVRDGATAAIAAGEVLPTIMHNNDWPGKTVPLM